MNKFIVIHGDQWKLDEIQESVEWSKQQAWKFKKYNAAKDHDHCLICYWTIYESDNEGDGYGYFSGHSTWLCTECYGIFFNKP